MNIIRVSQTRYQSLRNMFAIFVNFLGHFPACGCPQIKSEQSVQKGSKILSKNFDLFYKNRKTLAATPPAEKMVSGLSNVHKGKKKKKPKKILQKRSNFLDPFLVKKSQNTKIFIKLSSVGPFGLVPS